ncbi:MAG: HD domain-containing protein [Acidobacteriota bacterium]
MKRNESLLDVVLELQHLDRVPRSGWTLRGVTSPESVTEHSWHVLFLVWALGPRVPDLDVARAVEIALVHDLAEVRLGDLPRTAGQYFPPGAKKSAERAVIDDVLAPLPERSRELYREYEAGSSAEARLVKACDKLQLMLKATTYETWGSGGLSEFWENEANFPEAAIEPVRELFEALRRRREEGECST